MRKPNLRSIEVVEPNAGSVWWHQVPWDCLWRILRVQMTFTSGVEWAEGGEARLALLNEQKQGKLIHPSFVMHQPNQTLRYLFAPGVFPTAAVTVGVPIGLDVTAPLSDPCYALPGWWVVGSIGNIETSRSNQISNISMLVEEWPENLAQ